MGTEVTEKEKMVAFVLCAGNNTLAVKKYIYNGVYDCVSADILSGGDKACSYGCLGLGSCVKACQFDAIVTEDGLVRIIPEKCTGCKKCVATCPKKIITMVPAKRAVHVVCSSQDKGPVVRKACKVGCIGCKRCTKDMPGEEIYMVDMLAVVNYEKPLQQSAPADVCPTKAIQVIENEFTDPIIAPEPAEVAAEEERA
jgi:electron transport complex protein RnfB